MGIIAWIIFGGLVGWIASKLAGTDEQQGPIANIFVGILGALVGGALFNLIGGKGITGFNLWSMLVALVGSVILLLILRAFHRPA